VLTAIDARMQEVYWGEFHRDDDGLPELLGEERVIPPAMVSVALDTPAYCSGTGWAAHGNELVDKLGVLCSEIDPEALPRAEDVARLGTAYYRAGQAVDAAQALPVYLRDNVAAKPGGKR
jgi:tRNA threonylcarbamoyladenosine biosynthesis protein TsaB